MCSGEHVHLSILKSMLNSQIGACSLEHITEHALEHILSTTKRCEILNNNMLI
jgi:hypothetical protein